MTSLAKKKLLIVDDEENLRTLYEAAFVAEGYDVVLADCGRAALSMLSKERPDLVVLDIRMPGMDGLDTMGDILSQNNQIPVVINSAYTHYKENFMSWSADAYVVKSSDLSELKGVVSDLLSRGKGQDDPATPKR